VLLDAFGQWDLMLKGNDAKASIEDLSMEECLGHVMWKLQPGSYCCSYGLDKPLQIFLASCGQY